MIQIQQLKLHIDHTEADLREKIVRQLHIREDALLSYHIEKRSLDARRKPELFYVYTVWARIQGESRFLKKNRDRNISSASRARYRMEVSGRERLKERPVVVGCGPAGLFCAYMLAKAGYRPLVLERGEDVRSRRRDVEQFWETGILDVRSNVQFGEGGAGTFSDGKLNTLVKDKEGRNRKVLEIFVEHGAPEEILYEQKPHIGTDLLAGVVEQIRNDVIRLGGEVRFHTQVVGIEKGKDGGLAALHVVDTHTKESGRLAAQAAVFAIGHSARDTFRMLLEEGVPMEAKAFAVGVRAEHPQTMINLSQYGREETSLGAAAYKLTSSLADGRGVYTFCMCPGGYVVNASSEEGRLAVNGMSYHDRAGENANSAVIVTVSPEDYGADGPLAGVEFQRRLEEKAYEAGGGKVPVQTFADFCADRASRELGEVRPQIKGAYALANVRSIFPEAVASAIEQGVKDFGKKIAGYDRPDAVLSGVESRTSSPVRILRDQELQSSVGGLYPCGEGAGYAGGITSAAMDGLKCAEAIARKYRPFDRGALD